MEIEKTVEFILSVQARLEASVQKHDERIAKLESSVATVTDLVGRLAQTEIRLAERIEAGFKSVEAGFKSVEAGFRELRELQANTEYKLNALIDTVDKLVRRDGHQE